MYNSIKYFNPQVKLMTKIKMKKLMAIILCIIVVIALAAGIIIAVMTHNMNKIPVMTFEEMLRYTTADNEDAIITVGIINNGKISYTVYGKDGAVLPQKEYTYEIGSVTKTFTCSLLCKAVYDGKADFSDSIDKYIELPDGNYYPSLEKLVTHTSGYKGYYFDRQMANNFFHGRGNDFYGIKTDTLNKQISENILEDKACPFSYSNFGLAVVGNVLESIYDVNYTNLINEFISSELKLSHTRISDGTGDLSGYWQWSENDAYIPAGAVLSTISDTMSYVNLHMTEALPYLAMGHEPLAYGATPPQYEKIGLRADVIGTGWMIDEKNGVIWHNGATSNFNSYVGFDKKNQIGVVILSNLPPNYRIPATIMGPKLITDLQAKK